MELFKGWLENHFIKHAVGARPILLLITLRQSDWPERKISLL